MMKKVLMITVYVLIGFQAKANVLLTTRMPASDVKQELQQKAEKQTPSRCMIKNMGIKFQGSYEEAFRATTEACFQKQNQAFVAREHHEPDQDRQILFVEYCANKTQCI